MTATNEMGAARGESGSRRSALVTGASSGIGHAFATHLARQAYDLTVVARRRERLDELAKRLSEGYGVQVAVLVADLTQPEGVRDVEEHIRQEHTLDLLVNNAGLGTVGRFAELDPDREGDEIQLNVIALVRLTRAALPGMIDRGQGGVINVSSMAGFQSAPFNATYGATKAFVNSFTEAVYEELRGTNVKLQALCPGFTRTEFQQSAGINTSHLPSFIWQTAEAVVETSLQALRRGDLFCVPGFANRVLSTVSRMVPHAWNRRLLASQAERMLR